MGGEGSAARFRIAPEEALDVVRGAERLARAPEQPRLEVGDEAHDLRAEADFGGR